MTHEAAIQHEFEKRRGKPECGIMKLIIVLVFACIILLILMKIANAIWIII
jgi:hypothetical protein